MDSVAPSLSVLNDTLHRTSTLLSRPKHRDPGYAVAIAHAVSARQLSAAAAAAVLAPP